MDSTTWPIIQTKMKHISDLYGIGIHQLNERLQALQFVVGHEGETKLLEYLLKSDLNPDRAADLYFNEKKENEHAISPSNGNMSDSTVSPSVVATVSTDKEIEKFPSPSASPSIDLQHLMNKENTIPITVAIKTRKRKRKRKRAKLQFDEENCNENKKRKLDKISYEIYDEHKATSMILSILKQYPQGIRRYQLLVQLQRENEGIKWSDSFQENVGEFNDFVKKHDQFKIFDVKNEHGANSRNFGIMSIEKYLTILRYRHNLYESDSDSDCLCGIN